MPTVHMLNWILETSCWDYKIRMRPLMASVSKGTKLNLHRYYYDFTNCN